MQDVSNETVRIWEMCRHRLIDRFVQQCIDVRKPLFERELMELRRANQIELEIQRRKRMLQFEDQMRQRKRSKSIEHVPQINLKPLMQAMQRPVPKLKLKPMQTVFTVKLKEQKQKQKKWSYYGESDGDDISSPSESEDEDYFEQQIARKEKVVVKAGQVEFVKRAKSQKVLMLELIQRFRKLDKFRIFTDPVDVNAVPDYLSVISNPMDFSTMFNKINEDKYASLDDFASDAELVFKNCMTFNSPSSIFYKQASTLKITCNRLVIQAKNEYGSSNEHKPFILQMSMIDNFLFPVDESEVIRKLSIASIEGCDGQFCYSYDNLGAFDLTTLQFTSFSLDRQICRECSSSCKCDSRLCLNRVISSRNFSVELKKKEVYGIDHYTFRQICLVFDQISNEEKVSFIEKCLLPSLNEYPPQDTRGSIKQNIHMEYSIRRLLALNSPNLSSTELYCAKQLIRDFEEGVRYPVYPKGYGIINASNSKISKNQTITHYVGEVYPPWRFFEKQCAIRVAEKKTSNSTLGFYNISMERLKDDPLGYDVLFVDACRKGNIASRFSHSCRPNCTTVVVGAGNRHAIAVIALRDIDPGEELCFNYHSITDNQDEYDSAICFCGQSTCSGRYVDYVGKETFQEVVDKEYKFPVRVADLLNSCSSDSVYGDYANVLESVSFRDSILRGCPPWLVNFTVSAIRFSEKEKMMLPNEMRKSHPTFTQEIAENESGAIFSSRMHSLAITIDKIKYVLRQENQLQEPPLRILSEEEIIEMFWNDQSSLVSELTKSISPHLNDEELNELIALTADSIKLEDGVGMLKSRLCGIRDFLRRVSPTVAALTHAAADILHLYINTKTWFVSNVYNSVTSAPLEESELGVELKESLPSHVLQKSYSGLFVLSCLLSWINPMLDKPENMYSQLKRLILQLPSLKSLFAVNPRHRLASIYESIHCDAFKSALDPDCIHLLNPMAMKDKLFSFENSFKNCQLLGSPIMDYYLGKTTEESLQEISNGLECNSVDLSILISNSKLSR